MTGMSRRSWAVLVALIVILALAARLIPGPRTIDDAYITFRYARNLLAGNGFVFNPGERVLGTTTPLFTLVLSAAALPFGGSAAPFPVIALIAATLFDIGACVTLAYLGRAFGRPAAGLATALAWAIAPTSVTFAVGGLETSLFVFLIALAFLAHVRERALLTGVLCGLAALTRPDALIPVALIALDCIWRALRSSRDRWLPLVRFAVPLAALALAWAAFAWSYFGALIPQSMLAKGAAYRLPEAAAFIRLLQAFGTPFMENELFGTWWIAPGLVCCIALSMLAISRLARRVPGAWPALVFPWAFLIIFSAANPLIFRWYLAEPLPFYMLSILIGVGEFSQDVAHSNMLHGRALPKPLAARVGWAVVAVWVVVVLGAGWVLHPTNGADRPAPEMAIVRLEEAYTEVARRLAPEVNRSTVVAAGDVGALGYFLDAHILDLVGLNSKEVTQYFPLPAAMYVINYAVPPGAIFAAMPDYVILLEVYGRNGLLKESRFAQAYDLVDRIDTDMYGSDGLLVFRRR
jgi:hypothetical protein